MATACAPESTQQAQNDVKLPSRLSQTEGWTLEGDGVWKRQINKNTTERYYEGSSGLKRALVQQDSLLELLEKRHRSSPSSQTLEQLQRHHRLIPDTRQTIESLSLQAESTIQQWRDELTLAEQEGPEPGCSQANDVFVRAVGDTVRRVGNLRARGPYAEARARFEDRCAPLTQTATVYAYTFVETEGRYEINTCGPLSGVSVNCSLYDALQGERYCFAHAYAYVQFSDGSALERTGVEDRCVIGDNRFCHIDEITYRTGTVNPADPCLVCDTRRDFYAWSSSCP